jgi:hypothetical protein
MDGAQGAKIADKLHDSFAQQGFAARESNLRYAQRDENPRHAQVLFERKLGERGAVGSSPAVDAAVVAPVGHRDAEIVDVAAEFVGKKHVARRWSLAAWSASPCGRLATNDRKQVVRKEKRQERTESVSFPNTGGAGVSPCTLGKRAARRLRASLARATTALPRRRGSETEYGLYASRREGRIADCRLKT